MTRKTPKGATSYTGILIALEADTRWLARPDPTRTLPALRAVFPQRESDVTLSLFTSSGDRPRVANSQKSSRAGNLPGRS